MPGEQLALTEVVSRQRFRPIHYLGSKLRLLESIRHAVDSASSEGLLCDLFAGSGTVSSSFAECRPTLAVDIQEYSRVICSAVLTPAARSDVVESVAAVASRSALSVRLSWAFEPLLELEDRALAAAERGSPEYLWSLMQVGSLARFDAIKLPLGAVATAVSETIARLRHESLSNARDSVIARQFGGAFFSYRQAIGLDAVLDAAAGLNNVERATAVAPLLSTASDIVNTVGKQFAQPIMPVGRDGTPKRHLLPQILRDRSKAVLDSYRAWGERYRSLPHPQARSGAIRADYREFLRTANSEIAVVYADPPYTRDHYSRYYHVLETMCLRDQPALSTTTIRTSGREQPSRGVYREDRHQSPFCIKSEAPGAFEELFRGVRKLGVPLVLSYSPSKDLGGGEQAARRSRVVGTTDLVGWARQHFSRVEVQAVTGLRHSKLNERALGRGRVVDAEVLIVCRP